MTVHMPPLHSWRYYAKTVVQRHAGLLRRKGVTDPPAVLSQDGLLQCPSVPVG